MKQREWRWSYENGGGGFSWARVVYRNVEESEVVNLVVVAVRVVARQ